MPIDINAVPEHLLQLNCKPMLAISSAQFHLLNIQECSFA